MLMLIQSCQQFTRLLHRKNHRQLLNTTANCDGSVTYRKGTSEILENPPPPPSATFKKVLNPLYRTPFFLLAGVIYAWSLLQKDLVLLVFCLKKISQNVL